MDPRRDVRLWQAEDGSLAAASLLWRPSSGDPLDAFVPLSVHPEYREQGLEDRIVAWAAARMRELAAERGVSARLLSGAGEDMTARIATLERLGFKRVRFFVRMRRSLDEPIPEPVLPPGYTLRSLAGSDEVPAWVELYNLSFVDHFNHHDLTVEARMHWLSEATYRAEQDIVAVAPDGTFAAFCKCYIDPHENARSGHNAGWISLLGTRRGYRNLGLGRAVLYAGLRQLKRDGVDSALLGVDADSPTGATRMYEAAGFEVVYRRLAFHKDL
jgi:mycothiol synthase